VLVPSLGEFPEDEGEVAYIPAWLDAAPAGPPDAVMVAATGRGDSYPAAAPFGGARALLLAMLASLGVTPVAATLDVPGIDAWTPFSSDEYAYTLNHPSGWEVSRATEPWSEGGTAERYADMFVRPDNDLGVAVWQQPAGDGADLESVAGLTAWAKAFCEAGSRFDGAGDDYDAFESRALPMCMNAGGDPCRAALLIPDSGTTPDDAAVYAFVPDWAASCSPTPRTG
jgi:hypothetical protein